MTESKRLDWAGARTRLERIQNSLDQAETPSTEDLLRVYQERARRLAGVADDLDTQPESELLVVFRLGQERYAVPVSEVTEVVREPKLAPVPASPPSVAGVAQVRGEIRPVYNLQHQLGIAQAPAAGAGQMILIRTAGQQFGIRVDAVEEIRTVLTDNRRLVSNAEHVRWITEDLVSVLNTGMLIDRER